MREGGGEGGGDEVGSEGGWGISSSGGSGRGQNHSREGHASQS